MPKRYESHESLIGYLRTLTRGERATFLLKYAEVFGACWRVEKSLDYRQVKVRKRYYRSEEWK